MDGPARRHCVGVGSIDVHVTTPAVQGVLPGQFVTIMGTSTAMVLSHPPLLEVSAAAMVAKRTAAYEPDPGRAEAYDALYEGYLLLHDYFGRGGNKVMHRPTPTQHSRGANQVRC